MQAVSQFTVQQTGVGVFVTVGVGVIVGVLVKVGVRVAVGVSVTVGVAVIVGVLVGVGVGGQHDPAPQAYGKSHLAVVSSGIDGSPL